MLRTSEKPPIKIYPKKEGRWRERDVDVDVCIIDMWDSLLTRAFEEVLVSEEGWEVVRVAAWTKTQWWVCMYTAIVALVTAAGTRPTDWARIVQKKGSVALPSPTGSASR